MKNNSSQQTPTSRRRFLELLTVSGAGLFAAPNLFAQRRNNVNVLLDSPLLADSPSVGSPLAGSSLVDSLPSLQCPTETGITVVWAVGRPAAGYVEFGTSADRLDQKEYGGKYGLNPYHERFLQVRLQGLKPNTRYYYRTVTRSFDFIDAYKFQEGEPVYSDIFSFETSGSKKSTGSFSVINDTHDNQETLKRLAERLALIGSDYTVWNGDLVSSYENANMAVETILRPGNTSFATEKPMLFVPGNHDYRGVWARNIPLLLPEWEHPAPEDRAFGRNFAVRTGPLALIGLDTGEDKPDAHPAWSGLASFEPYRTAQRDWLERALKSPAVASAPFVVAFCHIPLYSADPNANGGDSMDGYASFQRQAMNLWGPVLTKYGVQCLVAAHNHHFDYAPAASGRSWAQVRGGGPGPKGQITVIHGTAKGNSLEIIVDELNSNKELGRWTFPKRK